MRGSISGQFATIQDQLNTAYASSFLGQDLLDNRRAEGPTGRHSPERAPEATASTLYVEAPKQILVPTTASQYIKHIGSGLSLAKQRQAMNILVPDPARKKAALAYMPNAIYNKSVKNSAISGIR